MAAELTDEGIPNKYTAEFIGGPFGFVKYGGSVGLDSACQLYCKMLTRRTASATSQAIRPPRGTE